MVFSTLDQAYYFLQFNHFYANKLVLRGYSSQEELINPINEKDISNCLIVNVLVDENKVYTVSLDDSKC